MKTYLFPGQGSQSRGMGAALFDELAEITASADEVLGYSIKELCLSDPRSELNQTRFTQPALYVVNALSYFKKLAETGQPPDFVAGHSLGEFNALLAAGCFDFATGLRLVRKRGELMSQAPRGAMAAILNATQEEIVTALKSNGLENVDVANYNTPSQIVISGDAAEVGRAQTLFQQGRMRYYPLNTSGAFHSRFMRPAMEEFRAFLAEVTFAEPRIPVIANVDARPYRGDAVAENLARQIASTVRWSESIQYLMALGDGAMQFEEVGHGDVLTKMVFTIKQQTPPVEPAPKATPASAGATADNSAPATAGLTPAEKVRAWNQRHPIGTAVRSLTASYADLKTRTEAVLLFGHRAAVYMSGYNGYFDLDEITPA